MNDKLARETAAAQALLYAIRDEIDGDEQLAADMIEGSTNLHEAIDAAVLRTIELDAHMSALNEAMMAMRERQHRMSTQFASIRQKLQNALDVMGQRKLELPIATLSIRANPPSLNITDESQIPQGYLIPQPAKPDRKGILAAIKNGEQIPGTELNPPTTSLAIKTR